MIIFADWKVLWLIIFLSEKLFLLIIIETQEKDNNFMINSKINANELLQNLIQIIAEQVT